MSRRYLEVSPHYYFALTTFASSPLEVIQVRLPPYPFFTQIFQLVCCRPFSFSTIICFDPNSSAITVGLLCIYVYTEETDKPTIRTLTANDKRHLPNGLTELTYITCIRFTNTSFAWFYCAFSCLRSMAISLSS